MLNNEFTEIRGYCDPLEKNAFQRGGRQLVVYKDRIQGMVPISYSRKNVSIKSDHPNFWILERK